MSHKLPQKPRTPKWFSKYTPPRKPVEPVKERLIDTGLLVEKRSFSNWTEVDFTDLVEKYPVSDYTFSVYTEATTSCYESVDLEGTIRIKTREPQIQINSSYNAQLAKYEKDLATYKEQIKEWKVYKARLDEYEAEHKRISELNQLERLEKKYRK
jgi:hypothetical protein